MGAEFQEGLETEIIGELLERIDIASLLADNRTMDHTPLRGRNRRSRSAGQAGEDATGKTLLPDRGV